MPIEQATPANIRKAAAFLQAGRLVAFPTETVYGLGGDATNDRAVAAIFAAKGRPNFNPLIVHVRDTAHAAALATLDRRARQVADLFWPGPLTLVLPRRSDSGLSLLVSAGLESIAIRVPSHPVAVALIEASGRPLAAPSANPSGRISPTTAQHVEDGGLGEIALILDGGPCTVGIESSVLDLTGPSAILLRPGGVPREALETALGTIGAPAIGDSQTPASPGMLASHYAPRLPVRLDASARKAGEALVGFGPVEGVDANLSQNGDLAEAAANLFAMLRALDRPEFGGIAVMPIPQHGLGLAINDRLRRAAAPRS